MNWGAYDLCRESVRLNDIIFVHSSRFRSCLYLTGTFWLLLLSYPLKAACQCQLFPVETVPDKVKTCTWFTTHANKNWWKNIAHNNCHIVWLVDWRYAILIRCDTFLKRYSVDIWWRCNSKFNHNKTLQLRHMSCVAFLFTGSSIIHWTAFFRLRGKPDLAMTCDGSNIRHYLASDVVIITQT